MVLFECSLEKIKNVSFYLNWAGPSHDKDCWDWIHFKRSQLQHCIIFFTVMTKSYIRPCSVLFCFTTTYCNIMLNPKKRAELKIFC